MAGFSDIGGMFAAACAARRDRDFLIDADHRLDGAAALELSARMARGLAERGVRAGDRVALIARPSALHAVAWFAIARLGAVATSLHILETDARITETLSWLEAGLLVADQEMLSRASGFAPRGTAVIGFEDLSKPVTHSSLDVADLDAPVAIALSSGSTGRPKGVVHTHRTALASAAAGPAIYTDLNGEDALLVAIGTSFGGWLNVVLPAVMAGARLVFQPRFDPTLFAKALFDERITIAPLVPVMWRAVLGVIGAMGKPDSVRLAFMSGEGPGPQDIVGVRALVTDQVRAAYLSTEGGCAAGIVSDQGGPARAIKGAKVRVVTPGGPLDPELPPGEIGELALQAPSIAVGYWREPDRQRARFIDGWWLTGDLGKITAEGFMLVGRTDHVINSGGVKIHAEEVERALMRHPMVRQAGVVGVADPVWGQRVEAFVVAEPGTQPEQILDWCRSEKDLPAVKLPKRLVLVDQLPTGPTGKLYRRGLLQADLT